MLIWMPSLYYIWVVHFPTLLKNVNDDAWINERKKMQRKWKNKQTNKRLLCWLTFSSFFFDSVFCGAPSMPLLFVMAKWSHGKRLLGERHFWGANAFVQLQRVMWKIKGNLAFIFFGVCALFGGSFFGWENYNDGNLGLDWVFADFPICFRKQKTITIKKYLRGVPSKSLQ